MKKRAKAQPAIEVRPRIRILLEGRRILGPGMAEILQGIESSGSLRKSAQQMGMSYMKAWLIVKQLNQEFSAPLVAITRGGTNGGGASLTPLGREVLGLYIELEQLCQKAAKPVGQKLLRRLRYT